MPPKKKSIKKNSFLSEPTILGAVAVIISVAVALYVWLQGPKEVVVIQPDSGPNPAIAFSNLYPDADRYIQGFPSSQILTQQVRPDIYPEPVTRVQGFPSLRTRTQRTGPMQQVGILTGEGGSSNSAAPDRTILPLYGRELDPRRSKWNYYTRTDGTNPVQVPVRVGNRVCDDDRNGCNEVYSNDDVHVPALGRAFKATVYNKSF